MQRKSHHTCETLSFLRSKIAASTPLAAVDLRRRAECGTNTAGAE